MIKVDIIETLRFLMNLKRVIRLSKLAIKLLMTVVLMTIQHVNYNVNAIKLMQ